MNDFVEFLRIWIISINNPISFQQIAQAYDKEYSNILHFHYYSSFSHESINPAKTKIMIIFPIFYHKTVKLIKSFQSPSPMIHIHTANIYMYK